MHKIFYNISKGMAYLGGFILSVLIVMTCLSILGRSGNAFLHSDLMMGLAPGLSKGLIDLGVGPINGDYELVEAGMAFAIFSFIPLCQITGGHASVDIFTNMMSQKVNKTLQMLIEILFAFVLILIAWQLFEGMQSKMKANETSLLLQFPIWWAYALSLVGAVTAAIVSIYVAGARTIEFFTSHKILPEMEGADH